MKFRYIINRILDESFQSQLPDAIAKLIEQIGEIMTPLIP
nr:MAG TPA: protein of unknown function (DUF4709) [Caudoviricetes sp.]